MIDDILFASDNFIIELPVGVIGGNIDAYSLDGPNYDYIGGGSETSHVFIS
jgi:hypothetical protein